MPASAESHVRRRPSIFISYSHADEHWKDKVTSHLSVLQHDGHCTVWDDSRIGAGDDWFEQLQSAISAADIAVLLISADYLNSPFIKRVEIAQFIHQRLAEGLRVVPVIVRPCSWEAIQWLARLQLRPKGARPLSSLGDGLAEEALAGIAREVMSWLEPAAPTTAPLIAARSQGLRTDVDLQIQRTLSDLYIEAQRLAHEGQWDEVLSTLARIRRLDDNFPDPGGLEKSALRRLERVHAEAHTKQNYAAAVALQEHEQWYEALEAFRKVPRGYRDRDDRAREILRHLPLSPSERGLQSTLWCLLCVIPAMLPVLLGLGVVDSLDSPDGNSFATRELPVMMGVGFGIVVFIFCFRRGLWRFRKSGRWLPRVSFRSQEGS